MILPYSIPIINLEVIVINKKIYLNQECISKEISEITGFPIYEVSKILNTLSDVVAKKLSETINETEIKVINGVKINAIYKEFKSNLDVKTSKKIIVKPRLTKQYKQKINKLHRENKKAI